MTAAGKGDPVVPWWCPTDQQPAWATANRSMPVGKSMVRRRQVVTGVSKAGAPVLVNAAQYVVLLKDLGTSGIQMYVPGPMRM